MSAEIILSGSAIFISGATFLATLALLGRKQFQYATKKDLAELRGRMDVLGGNQVRLWRYTEAVDDRCDSAGLPMLRPSVPRKQAPADW